MEKIGKSSFRIIEKPEIYSFDELDFLSQLSGKSGKINEMKAAVSENPEKEAVFFMPDQSFSVFSVFQGDNSICGVSLSDFEEIVEKLNGNTEESEVKMFIHMKKKLNVLADYLEKGGKVHPVKVPQDSFSEIENGKR